MRKKYLDMSDKMNEGIILTADKKMVNEFEYQIEHLQKETKRVSASVDRTRTTMKQDSVTEMNKNRRLLEYVFTSLLCGCLRFVVKSRLSRRKRWNGRLGCHRTSVQTVCGFYVISFLTNDDRFAFTID